MIKAQLFGTTSTNFSLIGSFFKKINIYFFKKKKNHIECYGLRIFYILFLKK
jgi:hypothetical protein